MEPISNLNFIATEIEIDTVLYCWVFLQQYRMESKSNETKQYSYTIQVNK
jgi:hypothetical protein